jgi:hypothetical protein
MIADRSCPVPGDDIARAIRQRDRTLLDRVLEFYGVPANVRAFYRQSVPGRTGKTSKFTADRNRSLARAKLFYSARMAEHADVKRARAEMMASFPKLMTEETAVRLTEGRMPHINRICAEISGPPDFKIGR